MLAVEVALLFGGCALLWFQGLSPAARARASTRAALMPAWPLNPSQFFLFLWLIVCGGLLLQSIVGAVFKTRSLAEAPALVLTGGAFHGGMLLGIVLFKAFLEKGPARTNTPIGAVRAVRGGVTTVLIALPVLATVGLAWQRLFQALGIPLEDQDLIGIFLNTKSPTLLGLMIILAVVLAPVTEELIFRAGLFRYLRTRLPRWAALLLPALLFAALHANLASFAPLTVLGLILALAYERTGNIAVPMIAHALFNLNTILLIFAGLGL
ncbi:MAG: CPBP family intramembrane glutamic endopeptidase [Opitutales bacterium]